ncbi:hypothetical protein EON64_01305 [archaeon]|nr:MAG: hypothetical protein EON64_01305 [archaeon]
MTEGRTLWGARKKREAEDEDEDAVTKLHKEHKKGHNKASPKIADVENIIDRQVKDKTRKILADSDPTSSPSHMLQLIDQYLVMLEQIIDSEDFSTSYDENILKAFDMLQQYLPEEMTKELPTLGDHAALQAVAKEGLRAFRQAFKEFMAIAESPEKVTEFMDSLPADVAEVLGAVLRGDTSVLLDKLDEVPGEVKTLHSHYTIIGYSRPYALL